MLCGELGDAVETHNGELITAELAHDGGRGVTLYTPAEPPAAVVFAADGGWHTERLVAALERDAGSHPPIAIVGVSGRDDDDGRFAEYVPGVDSTRFDVHESFFLDDVPAWLSEQGVIPDPTRTAVWGASLGGEFALSMGVRHPDRFAAVFCASPGGGFRPDGNLANGEAPRPAYFVAGEQEPFFAENAQRWFDAVGDAGGRTRMEVRPGDHGGAFWYDEFPTMVSWAFA